MPRFYLHIPFFFFNDTATTEIYTLSLHDALPICDLVAQTGCSFLMVTHSIRLAVTLDRRSEEHTSELQSPDHLVCRLLLEKKKTDRSSLGQAANIVVPRARALQQTNPPRVTTDVR